MSLKWLSWPVMPTPRVYSTPFFYDNKVYVVGGCDKKGQPIDSFEVFDIATLAWKILPNMPTKRAAPAVACFDNKLYAIGGISTTQQPLAEVEMFDMKTEKWTKMNNLSEPLLGLSSVIHKNEILIIGGMSSDTNPRNTIISFNPRTNKWKSLKPMPTPRYATFSFLINDNLYVIGGRQGKLATPAFEVYNFSSQTWKKLPDIRDRRVFSQYVHSGSHIICLGGLKEKAEEGFTDGCDLFDLTTEQWKAGKSMKDQRADFGAGFIGGKVIVAGGIGRNGKPMMMTEKYDIESDTWESCGDMSSSHCSSANIQISYNNQDYLLVMAGLGIRGPSKAVDYITTT